MIINVKGDTEMVSAYAHTFVHLECPQTLKLDISVHFWTILENMTRSV